MTAQIRWTHCAECFKALPLTRKAAGDSECDTCAEKATTARKQGNPTPPNSYPEA